jgi:hypothetical protein
MENPILKQLEPINSLSVNTALWVFRKSFDDFYTKASVLPLEEIDDWVKGFNNQEIKQAWTDQKQRKYPHLFIYGMLWHYKYKTLQEKQYQRESSRHIKAPNSKKDWHKHAFIVEQIAESVLFLPFNDGVAFLGELIGAWMLTCPEAVIRSENNVENVGKWQVGKETTDWDVPIPWIKVIYSGDAREMVRDKEMQLLFVLDFLLHFTFDDYDTGNTT